MEITNEMIYAQLVTINKRLDQMEMRMDRMEMRMDQIEMRMDQIETSNKLMCARLDQMDKRFEQQEANSTMMFDFFKDFKAAVNREFDQVNREFDQVNKRLDKMEAANEIRFTRIEQRQEEDHKILMDLWEHRENMKIGFSGKFLVINGISSGLIAVVVSIFSNALMK